MADETVKLRHTAAQVDDGIDKANAAAPKSTVYTREEVDTALAAKADSSDVYGKDAVDDLLEGKVDVETGKGLSTNDYTNAEKAKLANLENYDDTEVKASIADVRNTAEETVQEVEDARGTYASLGERLDDMGGGGGGGTSNYNQLTNKPSINGVTLTGDKTTSDLGIVENAQADWSQTDSTADDYIKNKPTIPTVDQTYDVTSENAQAGTAVAQAISTKVDKVAGKGLSENDYANADKAKLDGIEAGAEANVQADWNQTDTTADDYIKNKPVIPDAQIQSDWNQTNTESKDFIKNKPTLGSAASKNYTASVTSDSNDLVTSGAVYSAVSAKADLVDGKVPSSQLPSYVDDVVEYASASSFPAAGESGKIYIAQDTNKTYRWSGSGYTEISESLALGETSSTAYAGNKGKANADAIAAIKDGASIDSFADVEASLAGKQSALTTAQQKAVNSGITESIVNKTSALINGLYMVASVAGGNGRQSLEYTVNRSDFNTMSGSGVDYTGTYLIHCIEWSSEGKPYIGLITFSGGQFSNLAKTDVVTGFAPTITIDGDKFTISEAARISVYALR